MTLFIEIIIWVHSEINIHELKDVEQNEISRVEKTWLGKDAIFDEISDYKRKNT